MTKETTPQGGLFALWCTSNEIRRALGGHPNDPAVDVPTTSTLRAMRDCVRQKGYLKDAATPNARWVPDGTVVEGVEGLRQTLAEGFTGETRLRRVWIDEASAGAIAAGSARVALALKRARECTGHRDLERAERRKAARTAAKERVAA